MAYPNKDAPLAQGKPPKGGTAGKNTSGPSEDEVAGAADQEAKPISLYADRAFRHIVERSRQSLHVGLGSSVEGGVLEGMVTAQGNVHEGAGLDTGTLSHLRRIPPIAEHGSACENESPEATSHADERAE